MNKWLWNFIQEPLLKHGSLWLNKWHFYETRGGWITKGLNFESTFENTFARMPEDDKIPQIFKIELPNYDYGFILKNNIITVIRTGADLFEFKREVLEFVVRGSPTGKWVPIGQPQLCESCDCKHKNDFLVTGWCKKGTVELQYHEL